MQKPSEIKQHIKSVGDTRKITSAMELISVVKMRKVVSVSQGAGSFLETVAKMFNLLAGRPELKEKKAFLEPPKSSKKLLFVISSNRGLCGGFNAEVIKRAEGIIKNEPCAVFVYGKAAADYFASHSIEVEADFSDIPVNSAFTVKPIGDKIFERYLKDDIGAFDIVYTKIEKGLSAKDVILPVLPYLQKNAVDGPVCDPGAEIIYERLLKDYVGAVVFGALIRSSAAEHTVRRTAMNTATNNAAEMLDGLNLKYHQARQEKVTGELSEIFGTGVNVKRK